MRKKKVVTLISMLLFIPFLNSVSPIASYVSVMTTVPKLDFFPIGLYDVPLDKLGEVKDQGFNMVHLYYSNQTLAEAETYLKAAEAAGIKVLQNMPVDYLYAGDSFWIEWVTRLSAYDSLAAWYVPEEPDLTYNDHAILVRLYSIIHQNDPRQRPVATYFGTIQPVTDSPLKKWCDVVDIMMLGAYPEYHNEPRASVKTWIDAAREACPSRVIVGVPQFFDTSRFGIARGYPTPRDARFDAYTAIIAGARGLNWFSYSNGVRLPELWREVRQIADELNALEPVLLAPDSPQTITVNVISGADQSPQVFGYIYDSIQLMQKDADQTYLFASNLATSEVVAEFNNLPKDATAVNVLYEQRTVAVAAGSFRDSFAGNAVHIYRVTTDPLPFKNFLPYVISASLK